jgi:hypothetical protein
LDHLDRFRDRSSGLLSGDPRRDPRYACTGMR